MSGRPALLSVAGLRTEFPTRRGIVAAVDGVDLEIGTGEALGVVGESGSGKSVTFLSVLGLIRPPGRITAGSVRFDGADLRGLPPEALRRLRGKEIALTMQDALSALNPAFTVGTQITEALVAHRLAAGRADARAQAVAILKRVGIPAAAGRLDDYPHQFSGGMRQRVMIAIALACRPRLLIADEPTTALDVTIRAQVLDLIAELRRDIGMAVALITHDLGVVAQQCDRVMVMYAGRVVETGPTAAVIAGPAHPYTRGLLASLPRLYAADAPLTPIPGAPPDPTRLPAGCRFAPRCAEAGPGCEQPQLLAPLPGQDGRSAACWRATGVTGARAA